MKKDFLLEVLVQELPYKFIPSAISQLKSSFEKLFCDNGLDYQDIKVYATPRRLAVIVSDLALEQQTIKKDLKGPILTIAKDDKGEYTPAALGFAKKNGVDISSLYEKDGYIYASVEIKGNSTIDILKNNVESLILKLQGSHFMRWGTHTEKFSRPIEGVVALLGTDVVDLKIIDKIASNKTEGHRYSKNRIVEIKDPKSYLETLKSAQVIADQKERKEEIIKSATKCAQDNGLTIKFDNIDELLEEVTFITEWPVPVLCDFDKKYLQIPSIVTTTVMSTHQRYFPLWEKDGKLSNHFITMANYVGNEFENIKAGNQRVICARLEDGVFFFKDDTKTKLIDKLDALSGMTFQKGLGTLFDKTQRLIKLSEYLGDKLAIIDKTDLLRAATLAKSDLSTKLVFEFTELQGFIGQDYALLDGEKDSVARVISEHYFPLGANSELPSELIGQIVSIADKVDTICALFLSTQFDKKKKRPTGSNDPLGARRAAIGILRIIIENNLNINLDELIKFSTNLIKDEFNIELENTYYDEIKDFFVSRLIYMYEKDFSSQVMESVKIFDPLVDLAKFISRAKIITNNLKDDDFNKIKENATRVSRILKTQMNAEVDEALFVLDEEKKLFEAIKNHNQDASDLQNYIKSLKDLIEPVSNFFDKVLVMDNDEKIKNNRLSLLTLLKEKFNVVCDFEKL